MQGKEKNVKAQKKKTDTYALCSDYTHTNTNKTS